MQIHNNADERVYFDLFGKTFLKSCFSCDMADKDYLRFKKGKTIEEKEYFETDKNADV